MKEKEFQKLSNYRPAAVECSTCKHSDTNLLYCKHPKLDKSMEIDQSDTCGFHEYDAYWA